MQQFARTLQQAVDTAWFDLGRHGRLSAADANARYASRTAFAPDWAIADDRALRVDQARVDELATVLRAVLHDYVASESDCIGNGVFQVTGGSGELQHPTIPRFARVLIVAAVRIGARKVADMVRSWAGDEPIRTRYRVILDGVTVHEPIECHEIRLAQLPKRTDLLPAAYQGPFSSPLDYVGAPVLSLTYLHTPALYRPDDDDANGALHPDNVRTSVAGIKAFSLDRFCESMALAAGHYVGVRASWHDLGDLQAFAQGVFGGTLGSPARKASDAKIITEAQLRLALELDSKRQRLGSDAPRGLDFAIRRWLKSCRPGSLPDQLVELRIALDGLYARAGHASRQDVAVRGAWHVAATPKERRRFYDQLRLVYADASTVIHAGEPKNLKSKRPEYASVREICRLGILKKLDEGDPDWDDLILDR